MKLPQATAEIWVPDGAPEEVALARVNALGISAHQDDIEIMAMEGILNGFGNPEKWFMAAIVTNGAGSPRDGVYAHYTDGEMQTIRRLEQKKAAFVGEYSAVAFLDHTSAAVKNAAQAGPVSDLKALIAATRPETIYTHNLACTAAKCGGTWIGWRTPTRSSSPWTSTRTFRPRWLDCSIRRSPEGSAMTWPRWRGGGRTPPTAKAMRWTRRSWSTSA